MFPTPKYPDATAELTTCDGNAFALMGCVRKALAAVGVSHDEIAAFTDEAMSGDYDHLLQVCERWVTVL